MAVSRDYIGRGQFLRVLPVGALHRVEERLLCLDHRVRPFENGVLARETERRVVSAQWKGTMYGTM